MGERFGEVGRVRTVGKRSMQAVTGSHSNWRVAMATICTPCWPVRVPANTTRSLVSSFSFLIHFTGVETLLCFSSNSMSAAGNSPVGANFQEQGTGTADIIWDHFRWS